MPEQKHKLLAEMSKNLMKLNAKFNQYLVKAPRWIYCSSSYSQIEMSIQEMHNMGFTSPAFT